jgi:hypothetical protein
MALHTLSFPGTLGTNQGPSADGVLIGALTPIAPTKAILAAHAAAGLCITDDGGLYVNETTPFGEATADDVEVLPATPANDDACYFGHATEKFTAVEINMTTQGVGDWTITYEYWKGTDWAALPDVSDDTAGFTAASGWHTISFTAPEDWETCLVDNVLAYWVRGVVSGYTSVTTPPQAGQGYVVLDAPVFTDDTTDFASAGAGDVALLPAYPVVGDYFAVGHTEKFCKLKVTTSQARTGTATITPEYWNGTAWTTLTAVDDSVGWSATAGTHLIHFRPPTNWVANTALNGPNGQTGFFIRFTLTAKTSVTAQPLGTRGWVLPLVTGARGVPAPDTFTSSTVTLECTTLSGATADSKFLLVNVATGASVPFTWTKATASLTVPLVATIGAGAQLAIVQIEEDGSTEFAGATFYLR